MSLRAVIACLIAAALVSCGGRDALVVSLEVSTESGSRSVNWTSSSRLVARGVTLDGETVELDEAVQWTSDVPDVIDVDADGVATALSEGSVSVHASSGELTGTIALTAVGPVSARIVGDRVLALGGETTLSADVTFSDGSQRVNAPVVWSSDSPAVVTVSEAGLVHAVGFGATQVHARMPVNGRSLGSVSVEVAFDGTVHLDEPDVSNLAVGAQRAFSARVEDPGGAAVEGVTLFWTASGAAVAESLSSGVIRCTGLGAATVTVSLGGSASDSASFACVPNQILLATEPAGVIAVGSSDTLQLTVTVTDVDLQPVAGATSAVLASDDPGVLEPVGEHRLLAVADGTTAVRARIPCPAEVATCTEVASAPLSLEVVDVESVEQLAPPSTTLLAGEGLELGVEVSGAAGLVSGILVRWTSSAPQVGSVGAHDGSFRCVGVGDASVLVDAGGVQSEPVVLRCVPADVALVPLSATIAVNDTQELVATPLDASASPVFNGSVTEFVSSDPSVAEIVAVDPGTGQATGRSVGTTEITASIMDVVSPAMTLTVESSEAPVFEGAKAADIVEGVKVRVTWSAAGADSGDPANSDDETPIAEMRYEIYLTPGVIELGEPHATVTGLTEFTSEALPPGVLYNVRVHAVDEHDNRDANTVVLQALTEADGSRAPTFAGVTQAEVVDNTRVRIRWPAAGVDSGDPANTDDLTPMSAMTYQIFIAAGDDPFEDPAAELVAATEITTASLSPATDYRIQVHAVDENGLADDNTVELVVRTVPVLGTSSTGGFDDVSAVRSAGELAVGCAGADGLWVYDASDDSAVLLDAGVCVDLALEPAASLVAVALGAGGVSLVDVADPASPAEVGEHSADPCDAVALGESTVYCASADTVRAWDITTTDAPSSLGEITIESPVFELLWAAGRLYVVTGSTVEVWDAPGGDLLGASLGTFELLADGTAATLVDARAKGTRIYAAFDGVGVVAVDTTMFPAQAPVPLFDAACSASVVAFDWRDGVLACGGAGGEIEILDVANARLDPLPFAPPRVADADGDATALSLVAGHVIVFEGADATVINVPPVLVSTAPAADATNVSLAANVVATFSEPVATAPLSVTLEGSSDERCTSVTASGRSLTCALEPLLPDTLYRLTVADDVVDLDGAALGSGGRSVTFTTGTAFAGFDVVGTIDTELGGSLNAIDVTPDGARVVVVARSLDAATESLATWSTADDPPMVSRVAGFNDPVAVRAGPRGDRIYVVTATGGSVITLDATDPATTLDTQLGAVETFRTHRQRAVVSPFGEGIAFVVDGVVQRFDADLAPAGSVDPEGAELNGLAFSRDGRSVVTAGGGLNVVRRLDLTTGEELARATLVGEVTDIRAAHSTDDLFVATAEAGAGRVLRLDADLQVVASVDLEAPPETLAVRLDDATLYAVAPQGSASVVTMLTGALERVDSETLAAGAPREAVLHPGGRFLYVAHESGVVTKVAIGLDDLAGQAPVLRGFRPRVVEPGGVVELIGWHFDPISSQNLVRFDGADVRAAEPGGTTVRLDVTVPDAVGERFVSVGAGLEHPEPLRLVLTNPPPTDLVFLADGRLHAAALDGGAVVVLSDVQLEPGIAVAPRFLPDGRLIGMRTVAGDTQLYVREQSGVLATLLTGLFVDPQPTALDLHLATGLAGRYLFTESDGSAGPDATVRLVELGAASGAPATTLGGLRSVTLSDLGGTGVATEVAVVFLGDIWRYDPAAPAFAPLTTGGGHGGDLLCGLLGAPYIAVLTPLPGGDATVDLRDAVTGERLAGWTPAALGLAGTPRACRPVPSMDEPFHLVVDDGASLYDVALEPIAVGVTTAVIDTGLAATIGVLAVDPP